jgi:hypothetical protein
VYVLSIVFRPFVLFSFGHYVVCLLIWDDITPSLLIKFIVSAYQQEKTILPSGRKEHPLIILPLMFDIVSNEVLTTIPMDTNIVDMAIRGGTIYYCAWEKGLKKINISDQKTILPSGRKEHPLIILPLMFIFWFSVSCMLSTDTGADRSATTIWACLSFLLTMIISHE